MKCPVCNDHCDIEECLVFLIQTIEDRNKRLNKKLYYDALAIFPKNIMQNAMPIRCAKFAVEEILEC